MKSRAIYPVPHKSGMTVHTCNSSIEDVDTQGSGVQDWLWPHHEFKFSLGSMRSCAHDYSKTEAKTRLGPRGMSYVWQQQWLKTSHSPGELVWERKYEWSEKPRNTEIGWQLPGHKSKIKNELTKVLKSEAKMSQQTLHTHPEAMAMCLTPILFQDSARFYVKSIAFFSVGWVLSLLIESP